MSDLGPLIGLPEDTTQIGRAPSRSIRSFENKYAFRGDYAPLRDTFSSLPPQLQNTVIEFDRQRAARGQNVLGVEDTIAGINTALTGQPHTPPPERNPILDLPRAALRDIKMIGQSIPRMPVELVKDVLAIPGAITEFQEKKNEGQNTLQALASSPGVRLLPGSFTVEQIAAGEPVNLLRHPVITTLDVLPFASKGLKAAAATPKASAKMAAIRESPVAKTLLSTSLVLKAREVWGTSARETSSLAAEHTATIMDRMDPKIAAQLRDLSVYEKRGIDMRRAERLQVEEHAETELMKRTQQFAEQHAESITPERMAEIKKALEYDDSVILSSLTGPELALVHDYRDLVKSWENYSVAWTNRWRHLGVKDGIVEMEDPFNPGTTELFPQKEAATIEKKRRRAEHVADMSFLRDLGSSFDSFDPAVPETFANIVDLAKKYAGESAPVKTRGSLHNFYKTFNRILKSRGYVGLDTEIANVFQKKLNDPIHIAKAIEEQLQLPAYDIPQILSDLRANVDDIQGNKIANLIENGELKKARNLLRAYNQTRWVKDNPHLARLHVSRAQQTLKAIVDVENRLIPNMDAFHPRKVKAAQRAAENAFRNAIPGRFNSLVEREMRREIQEVYNDSNLSDEIKAEIAENLAIRNMSWMTDNPRYEITQATKSGDEVVVTAKQILNRTKRQVRSSWLEMKKAGINPTYVHRVNPDVAAAINFPGVHPSVKSVSSLKKRTLDISPHYDDLTIAVSHQGLEWLTKRSTEELIDALLGRGEYAKGWAKSKEEVINEFLPRAYRAHKENPSLDVMAHAHKLAQREYMKFDPYDIFPFMKGRLTGFPSNDVYLPKVVASTIKRYFNDSPGFFAQAASPIVNTFRTSVLALSPRWHVYNVFGGLVMMLARTDPFTIWKYYSQAREYLRNPSSIPQTFRGELGKAELYQHELLYQRGGTLGLMDKAKKASPLFGQVADTGEKLVKLSFKGNQIVDDIYRTMSYLYGYDKAMNKGMSRAEATKAGVELSRKIMPDWNALTPIERNQIRAVLPFYGFMSHVMRYVFTYPYDHPVRASILANFAEAELTDLGEATPQYFMELIGYGSTDEEGNRRYAATGGWNPFADVADLMTFAGLVRSTNPLIATAAEQVGLTDQGMASAYPDVVYDSQTGRLRVQSGNPFATLFANTLPQADLIAQLANPTSRLNQLRARDPEVADAIMRGAVGIPNLTRKENIQSRQIQAEMSRQKDQDQRRADALRTGIYSQAKEYPQLREYFAQLAELQKQNPDAFQMYDPAFQSEQLGLKQTPGVRGIGEAAKSLLLGGVLGG